ncbi:DinB family protein [Zavarzinella formosa]|uniref:DinB family protein n=1 Tax=Zavarzinella formosa TaxID=360055 RepID=UPI0002EFB0C1|nr:DinB family protein [Zavarzinella formosa]
MTANDLLVNAYQTAGKLIHVSVDDLTPEEFAAQPVAGANSVAWIVGHLAKALSGSVTKLGGEAPAISPELAAKVRVTGQKADAQTDVGDPKELLRLFDEALAGLLPLLRALTPEKMAEPRTGPMFATNQGEAILFGATHIVIHAGQISLLRRALGKPPRV